ncbi:hypothetical protein OJAV_G00197210 [Oryzias javanicus]|uniref:Uncharacterized protein n=1 Tax=Oryzias javanicus TaxID=123683 RepID=A0A437C8E7_ORYJA|nr:hypothetical protein OJAV_G00197210 [Oryzias javanicus]
MGSPSVRFASQEAEVVATLKNELSTNRFITTEPKGGKVSKDCWLEFGPKRRKDRSRCSGRCQTLAWGSCANRVAAGSFRSSAFAP